MRLREVCRKTMLLSRRKKTEFSDKYLSQILEVDEDEIRNKRISLGVEETWEGVHVSGTQDRAYYYSTYNGTDKNPISEEKPKIMILGGGPNRIGQGIEFDYCCVHASLALKSLVSRRSLSTVTLKRYLQTMTHLINCILSRLHWKTY